MSERMDDWREWALRPYDDLPKYWPLLDGYPTMARGVQVLASSRAGWFFQCWQNKAYYRKFDDEFLVLERVWQSSPARV